MNEQPPCSVALDQGSIVMPASARDDIIRRDGKYCWLCNMHGVHVTQVISSADQLLVFLSFSLRDSSLFLTVFRP